MKKATGKKGARQSKTPPPAEPSFKASTAPAPVSPFSPKESPFAPKQSPFAPPVSPVAPKSPFAPEGNGSASDTDVEEFVLSKTPKPSAPSQSSSVAGQITRFLEGTPSRDWEMDFYSRPVLDSDRKKLWELVICDSTGSFKYAEMFSVSQVNSAGLREALLRVIDEAPVKPRLIRYFRQAMANTIKVATNDLGVTIRPSRRTYALVQFLEERMDPETGYYVQQPGYKPELVTSSSPFSLTLSPSKIPDQLLGEKWTFIAFPKKDLEEICAEPRSHNELCPLTEAQRRLPADTLIPGVVIYSERALPLSSFMAAAEVNELLIETIRDEDPGRVIEKKFVIVEAGTLNRWTFSNLNSPKLKEEADLFTQQKEAALSLHFVAIQPPDQSEVTGFFLLQHITIPT